MSLQRSTLLGGLVLLVAAVFSAGFHHWDEHFQILEFAGWKLGLSPAEALTWEFGAKLRPALQPMLVVLLHKLLALFGTPDPFLLTMLLRVGTAALSFFGIVLLVCGQLRDNPALAEPVLRRWYLFLSFFLWFGVYNAVRFSSEGLSTALFLIAFVLVLHGRWRSTELRYLAAGLMMGAAFVLRYQTGLMIAGLLLWELFIRRTTIKHVALAALGIMVFTAVGIVVDRWFYGTWTLTLWTYLAENLIEGKAAAFSTEPWWDYFAEILERGVPPFSLLYLLPPFVVFLFRRKDPLTWVVLPFLLVHMLIGHKELRFLFPLLGLLPLLIITGLAEIKARWWPRLTEARGVRIAAVVFAVVQVPLLLVSMFKPADTEIALYRTVYRSFPDPITLYHGGEHPYHRVADIHFYLRPGLQVESWPGKDAVPQGHVLFVGRAGLPEGISASDATVLYTSFPEWVLRFNIGGWVERTNKWTVWEVRKP